MFFVDDESLSNPIEDKTPCSTACNNLLLLSYSLLSEQKDDVEKCLCSGGVIKP